MYFQFVANVNLTRVKMVDPVTMWELGTNARVLSVLKEARVKVREYVDILLHEQLQHDFLNV